LQLIQFWIQRNARCHRKTKSASEALTQHYQDQHPLSKKYSQVSTPQLLMPQELKIDLCILTLGLIIN